MKRTVGRWTAIQTKLPDDRPGGDLWSKIEYRTFGRRGQSKVPIKLSAAEQTMVDQAEKALDAEHGKYVEFAG